MALLMVVMSLAIISAVVTDLLIDQTSGYQIALRQRDALKAEALAEGALNLGALFLTIQNKIQVYFTQFAGMGVPLPSHTVWEMLPIDSNLFQGLSTGDLATTLGLDVSEALKKRKEEEKTKLAKLMKEREEKTRSVEGMFLPPEGGFGAFEGTFSVTITDEESKISFHKWTDASADRIRIRKLLVSLMAPLKYDYLFKKISREDLIANIYDYLDTDEIRINANAIGDNFGLPFGGSEQELYIDDKGILPKNAYFDSLEELNLVHGFSDRHMRAFGPALTIYGGLKKINILSAKEAVIEPLIRYCAKNVQDPLLANQVWVDGAVAKWKTYKTSGQGPVNPKGFVDFLSILPLSVSKKECEDVLGVESQNFTLKAQATVGGVTRSMTLVARINKGTQESYYFKVQ